MIKDKITFKYSESMYSQKEVYEGVILSETDTHAKVKITKAKNQWSDDSLEGEIVKIAKSKILKGLRTESVKRIDESLKFVELKDLIRQWAEQNNLILKQEEKEEMELEEDDFVFVDNMIEFEKLRKKLGTPLQEQELDFENNKVRVGLFRDLNANEFIVWYIIQ